MGNIFTESIHSIPGLGEKTKSAAALKKIGIKTIADLLFHFPRNYSDRSKITPISELYDSLEAVVQGTILNCKINSKNPKKLTAYITIKDDTGFLQLVFFNYSKYQADILKINSKVTVFGKVANFNNSLQMANPEFITIDANACLTPEYPLTANIKQNAMRKYLKSAVDYLQNEEIKELLPFGILPITFKEALKFIHQPSNDTNILELVEFKHISQQRIILEELVAHNLTLQALKKKIHSFNAFALPPKENFLNDFEAKLPFKLTNAQKRAFLEISHDLSKNQPMTRLVQGDVGCGKTMVAILSALQVALHNKQVAVMVPTEILATQHYESFSQILAMYDVKVAILTGKMKAKEKRELLNTIKEGTVQIIIGTHALIQEDVEYKNLSLIIIDEQHRFGVEQRLSLNHKAQTSSGYAPHVLSMTATPIPRTLAQTTLADMDVSIIDELPPNRKPVVTVVRSIKLRDKVIEHIRTHLEKKEQVYWVCCLVKESEYIDCQDAINTSQYIQEKLPNYNVGLLHGQQKPNEKQEIMEKFINKEIDILVATSVIEVGVNNPNAFLIVIENAERHGLAQLHQLRGRVGRGNLEAFCCLLYGDNISSVGVERLKVLEKSSDGFYIAEQDLKIRGPGDIIGTRQTGELNFKVANMLRDTHLIEIANNIAVKIADNDETLMNELIERWYKSGVEIAES